jgi:hypothetical protein
MVNRSQRFWQIVRFVAGVLATSYGLFFLMLLVGLGGEEILGRDDLGAVLLLTAIGVASIAIGLALSFWAKLRDAIASKRGE